MHAIINVMLQLFTLICNIGVFIAYTAIPFSMLYILLRAPLSKERRWSVIWISLTLFTCGLSHIIRIVTLFNECYWLECFADIIILIIGIRTFIGLPSRILAISKQTV